MIAHFWSIQLSVRRLSFVTSEIVSSVRLFADWIYLKLFDGLDLTFPTWLLPLVICFCCFCWYHIDRFCFLISLCCITSTVDWWLNIRIAPPPTPLEDATPTVELGPPTNSEQDLCKKDFRFDQSRADIEFFRGSEGFLQHFSTG